VLLSFIAEEAKRDSLATPERTMTVTEARADSLREPRNFASVRKTAPASP